VWSTSDGSLEASLTGHQGEVRSVALSHDGTMAASGAVDKKVILWVRDSSSGGWMLASEGVGGHSGCVAALSFEGGESSLGRVASGSYDRTVRVWKVEKEGGHDVSEAVKLSGHTHWVMGVCWVGGGPEAMVASASYDRTVRLNPAAALSWPSLSLKQQINLDILGECSTQSACREMLLASPHSCIVCRCTLAVPHSRNVC
jgi:WD40 repeat protein